MSHLDVSAIVFDLDGTLIDSREDIADALNHTFLNVGYDPLPMELIANYVGNGILPLIRQAVASAGHPEREAAVTDIFRARYGAHLLDKTEFFDTVEATLDKFLGRGIPMGLVSNKPARFTLKIAEELRLSRYFGECVYGGDTLPVSKPDPRSMFEIADKYGVDPNKMMIVGDSSVDILTGKNAGAHTVGVRYGYREVAELEAAGADMFIDRFDELLDIV